LIIALRTINLLYKLVSKIPSKWRRRGGRGRRRKRRRRKRRKRRRKKKDIYYNPD